MFQRIALSALVAGVLGGVLITLVQGVAVTPLIFEAETYEQVGDASHGHDATVEGTEVVAEHSHDAEEWAPDDGFERTVFTGAANIVAGVGFALLLGAGFALRGRAVDWKSGLLWGAAGFLVFGALPALGLPPELPGTEAAPLIERQMWWLVTAAASATGLALIAFGNGIPRRGLGVVLLIAPHLVGAPQPEHHGGLAPEDLEHAFITASLVSSALFWLVLGAVAGFAFDRLGRQRSAAPVS
jgi:cobalt transporter subunit CbtA